MYGAKSISTSFLSFQCFQHKTPKIVREEMKDPTPLIIQAAKKVMPRPALPSTGTFSSNTSSPSPSCSCSSLGKLTVKVSKGQQDISQMLWALMCVVMMFTSPVSYPFENNAVPYGHLREQQHHPILFTSPYICPK
jgi:hypothetical protein